MRLVEITGETIKWPNKCAWCLASADTFAEADCSVVTKVRYYVIFAQWSSRHLKLAYPICRKHARQAAIAGRLSRRSLVNIFLSLIFMVFPLLVIFTALYVWLSGSAGVENLGFVVLMTVMSLVGISGYFYGLLYTPVKIKNTSNSRLLIKIINNDYASELKQLNISVE